ncbi:MAG: putative bicarbonate transporter, family [Micavibrio sp.]|nr:putative bicarbonate transporter, family [Micavibrio sp.]
MIKSAFRAIQTDIRMILIALCLAGSFTGAIFFSGFDKPYFVPALLLVAAGTLVALWPGFRKGWSFASAPVTWLLCGFWAWLALSMMWTKVPHVSMIFFVTISTLPMLFFSIVQSPRADDFIRYCRAGIMIPVTLLALSTIGQYFLLPDLIRDRINYPMLNPNNLAETLMMGVFLSLPLFTTRTTLFGRVFLGTIISLCVFAMMMTQSRGGMLALLVGSAIFAVVCHKTVRAQWKSFVILAAAILTEWAVYHATVMSRWGDSHLLGGGDAPEAVRVRYELWKSGWGMLKDYGFTGGAGLGSFYLTFPPYRQLSDTSDGFFLHVDPFQFGIETGIPATILFYAFCTAVLVRTINVFRIGPVTRDLAVPIICGFCGLLGLLINAHLDYPLYMVTSQIMAAIFLAGWYRATEDIIDSARLNLTLRNRAHRIFLIPLLSLLLLILPGWILRAGTGVYFDGRSSAALQNQDMDGAAKYAALSMKYSPDSYDRSYLVDGVWRVRLLQTQFYSLDPDTRLKLYETADRDFDMALERNPLNVPVMTQKAVLHYTVAPRLDADGLQHAREILEDELKLDPVTFEVRVALAKMYDLENRPLDSIRILEGGLEYKLAQLYAPPPYLFLLAQAYQKTGNMPAAQKAIDDGNQRVELFSKQAANQTIGVGGWVNQKIEQVFGN